jgi:hypothetical protein
LVLTSANWQSERRVRRRIRHGHGLTRIRPEFTSPETFFPLLKKRSDLRLARDEIKAVRQSTEEDVVPLLLRRRMRLWQTRRGASAADSELDM